MYYHKIMPDVFDNMIPWERDIYIGMIAQKIEEEVEKAKMEESANRAASVNRPRRFRSKK